MIFINYILIPFIAWVMGVIITALRKDISEWIRYLILVKVLGTHKKCFACQAVINRRVLTCPACNFARGLDKIRMSVLL